MMPPLFKVSFRLLVGVNLVCLCVPSALAVAAPDLAAAPAARVTGRVLDAVSAKPVRSARASVAEHVSLVDEQGRFSFELEAGRCVLEVTAEGYLPARRELQLASAGRVEVEVLLLPGSRFREQVDVFASAEAAAEAPATIPVRPAQVLAVAGGGENVFRVLQTLPGVTGTDEFSSRLSVRGGGPDQNLTVMDGVEIHNPYRLFGLTSAFNPETVERFELTAGAFSARYGDRLSSLLVVDNRAGSTERVLTGSAALSLTDTNLVLEGRLPRGRGSWLATGRRTYYDLVAERFTDNNLPSFDDLQGKTVLNLGRGRTLALFSLRSRETTDASFDVEEEAASGAIAARTRNDVLAATFYSPLGRRAWTRSIAATYTNTDSLDFSGSFRDEERRANVPGDSAFDQAEVALTWDGIVRDRSWRQELGFAPGAGHVIDTGFEAHRLKTRVKYTLHGSRNETEGNQSSLNGGAALPDWLDSVRTDTRLGAWLQDRWQVSSRVSLEAGLRLDRSTINARTTLSPRFTATFSLATRMRLRAALGLHTQSPGYEKLSQSDYFMDLSGRALAIDNERARHVLLAVERDLMPGVQARIEAYYKGFSRLIVGRLETRTETDARLARYDFPSELAGSLPVEPWVTSLPTNDGRGSAWGFDLYLAKRTFSAATRLSGWASYTYGRADRESFGRTYPFDYDRRHSVSAVASFRATSRLELAATARAASGFPYTPVLGLRVAATPDAADADGDGDREELIPERDSEGRLVYATYHGGLANLNSARMPYYARVDLRATYTPGWGRGRVRLYLDVMNALARNNAGVIVSRLEYDPDSDRPRVSNRREGAMPFLPSLGVHVTFGTPQPVQTDKPKAEGRARFHGFAAGVRVIGTQGMGVDLYRAVSRRFAARLGLTLPTTLPFEIDTGETKYDLRLKLGQVMLVGDFHPFAGSFHLSGGLWAGRHGFDIAAKPAERYDLGGVGFNQAEVGALGGNARVRHVAPYFGLGWGNAVHRKKRFGLVLDLGLAPQGVPRVTLHSDGSLAGAPEFERQLEREAGDLRDRLRGWRLFPVVALSLTYR